MAGPDGGLRPGEVHLWLIALRAPGGCPAAPCECLSSEERERAAACRDGYERARFTHTCAALRHLLGAYLDLPPWQVAMETGKQGKPALAAGWQAGALTFNCAHSGSLSLIGLTAGRERVVFARLARARKESYFYGCWVRKEALGKAIGSGLGESLRSLDVGGFGRTVAVADPRSPSGWWHVGAIPLPAGYAGAFCVPGGGRLRLRRFRYPADGAL